MKQAIWILTVLFVLMVAVGCSKSAVATTTPPADLPDPSTTPEPDANESEAVCPTADGQGTISPAVSIYAITFVVNGLEQMVATGDVLHASPGDQVQIREAIVCTESISGNGGEACVDLVPVDQEDQEVMSEHLGTHMVPVAVGFMTIPGPSGSWTVDENWEQITAVLNHWPTKDTADPDCGDRRCERDDRMIIELDSGDSGPDGGIVFYSNRDGNDEIYAINADGSDLRRLTDDLASDKCPDLSPDGTQIAFTSDRDGNTEIYVMASNGSQVQRLTNSPGYEGHPAWSPDGSQIAFVSEREGNQEIYVINAAGGEARRLTNNPAKDMRPNWSPDGTQIVFNSEREGNWDIYIMDADGSNQTILVDSTDWEVFPAWSPDGTQILFFSLLPDVRRQDIYTLNLEDGSLQQLTHNSRVVDEGAVWSPDGTQIAFQSNRDGNWEIYIMNADGSNPRRLTHYSGGDYWPSWGP